jgi:hypothetical protein
MLEPDEPDVEPEAALPLRLLCWSALEPAPALSRLHAAMPKASAAAVSAAVRVFIIASSPEVVGLPLRWSKAGADYR